MPSSCGNLPLCLSYVNHGGGTSYWVGHSSMCKEDKTFEINYDGVADVDMAEISSHNSDNDKVDTGLLIMEIQCHEQQKEWQKLNWLSRAKVLDPECFALFPDHFTSAFLQSVKWYPNEKVPLAHKAIDSLRKHALE